MAFVNNSSESVNDIDEINYKVINKLNKLLVNEVENLKKLPQYVSDLKQSHNKLENYLLDKRNGEQNIITQAIRQSKGYASRCSLLKNKSENIQEQMEILKSRAEELLKDVQPHLQILNQHENYNRNYELATQITEISKWMSENMKNHRNKKALEDYKKLCAANESLSTCECDQLMKFAVDTKKQWMQKLSKVVVEDFKKILTTIKFPFLREDSKIINLAPELNEGLAVDIEYFSFFDNDPDMKSDEEIPSIVKQFDACYPMKMFLKPIEIRFLYHFSGDKATNNKENPHWYFTQLLNWASLNEEFIDRVVQPKLPVKYHSKSEFLKGLIRMAVAKLTVDLPDVIEDDDLFSTTVQETLNFHEEMIAIGYPSYEASIVCVLTQPQTFKKWILLEEKYSQQLLDDFITSPLAFTAEEPNGICRCAEQLLLLMQGITNRYKQLPQPGHKIQFFELQLEIFDSYRLRIVQLKGEISNPTSSGYCVLLNTVHYVITTLEEWNDIPFFIELNYFRKKFSDFEAQLRAASGANLSTTEILDGDMTNYIIDAAAQEWTFKQDAIDSFNLTEPVYADVVDVGGAFDETIQLYEHVKSEMLRVLKNHALTEVRAKSYAYRKEKWFSNQFILNEDSEPVDLSPSVCLMLEILVKQLKSLKNHLAFQIFEYVWKSLASALDKFLYEELILENNFSSLGSAQLNFDIAKGFFPLFSEFTKKPANNFVRIKESLILLILPAPTALLLRDTLNMGREDRDFPSFSVSPAKALEEIGVYQFTVKEAESILKLRLDFSSL